MSDQCKFCSHRGDILSCLDEDCGQHENWIFTATQSEATRIERDRCLAAVDAVLVQHKEYYVSNIIDVVCDQIKSLINKAVVPVASGVPGNDRT